MKAFCARWKYSIRLVSEVLKSLMASRFRAAKRKASWQRQKCGCGAVRRVTVSCGLIKVEDMGKQCFEIDAQSRSWSGCVKCLRDLENREDLPPLSSTPTPLHDCLRNCNVRYQGLSGRSRR